MARHVEKLDGGVVDSKDAALLAPGELAAARNCYYLPKNPALTRARGRELSGRASATAVDVNGLRDAQFDNGDHILVALASASLLTGAVADSVTFGVLTSGLPGIGTQLESIQNKNRYFLLNGLAVNASSIGSNQVVYLSATAAGTPPSVRQHGMLPVDGGPATASAAGTFSQSVTGYYEYWTTEAAKITQDSNEVIIEGTFVGDPTTVFVSSTAMVPVIYMPALKNSITTHWRIYRSPVKFAQTDKKFPSGFLIADNVAAGASAVITAQDTATVTSTGQILPGNANGVGDGATIYAAWASAATLTAANDVYASGVVPASPVGFTYVISQGVYGFNFGGFSGNIKGIEVELKAYIASGTAPVPIEVRLGRNRQANGGFVVGSLPDQLFQFRNNTVGKSTQINATASGSAEVLTIGSSSDRWFPGDAQYPFVSSDFGPNFMAVLAVSKPSTSVGVDYVKVKVYYASTFDSTVQFPAVIYTFGDITSQVGKNGPPPGASTGDMFQDSLVCNDVSSPSLVRYSFPGDPEAFPSTYYVDFETRENDQVRMIKALNATMIVGLDSSLWRLNYLPNERDAQFDRGKTKESISRTYGVCNPMCACVYSPDGVSDRLMVVSHQGIHDTNGYDFRTLTDGVDWRTGILGLSATASAIDLVNDPERQIVFFHFRNDAYNGENYMALPLCYAPDQLLEGKPKIGGLIHMRNAVGGQFGELRSAWPVPRSNGDFSMYLGYGPSAASATAATAAGAGAVYRENGTTIPAADSTMKFTTRRLYLADFSNEWQLGELYGYVGSYTGSPVVTYSVNSTKTNDTGVVQQGSKTLTLNGQKLHKVGFRSFGEGLQLSAVITASAYAQEQLILDGQGWGAEDSGR